MAKISVKQIATNSLNQFVSNAQIASWDGKADASLIGAANGIATLDSNGKIPASQLPTEAKSSIVVPTYADLATVAEKTEGTTVLVIDATGDATVSSGAAQYVWDGTSWLKIAEVESLDLVLDWANVSGKIENVVETLTVTNGNIDNLTWTPVDVTEVILYVNGLAQVNGVDFTVDGTTNAVTWNPASFTLEESDSVIASYETAYERPV